MINSVEQQNGADVRSLPRRVGENVLKLRHFITIEPVVVLYILTIVCGTAISVFETQKACVTKLGYDLQVCEFFSNLEDDNICVEPDDSNRTQPGYANFTEFRDLVCKAHLESTNQVAFLDSYRNIIVGIVQTVVLPFAGSWSDCVGLRKPCILIPIAGNLVAFVVYILSAIFMHEIPFEATGIVPNLFEAFTGGIGMVTVGVFSYLTDVTDEKDRTFRFACSSLFFSIGPVIGNFFSGPLFKNLGFINLCIVCVFLDGFAILYGVFVLKESKTVKHKESPQNDEASNKLSLATLRKLFDFSLLTDCIKVLMKKRDFNYQRILCLTIFVSFINFGALNDLIPAINIAIASFKWISDLGRWISYDILTNMIGTMLAIGVLSKRLEVSDALICVFSVCFSIVGKSVMAIAASTVKPYLYYVATSIDIFDASRFLAIRSIVTKLVAEDETGKVTAVLSIVEAVQVVVYPTIFNTVYLQTQELFIGTVFILSEIFLLVSLGIYIKLYVMSRRSTCVETAEESSSKQGIDNPAVDMTAL